ncbi:beta strand repeat-containing protein [Gemmata sp.]|uniref:beta strand repeat-containing protein n=1 Tax=Gemmata sp. TaxID=1914242 RepID=UPI003F72BC4B
MSTTKRAARRPFPNARNAGLRVEGLEDRTVPAVITVTSLADDLLGDGLVTLREAIQAAELNTPVDGSAAGSGADTIVFAPGLSGDIDLSIAGDNKNGPTALLITTPITIDGFNGGDGIVIRRADVAANLRLLGLTASANLTLRGVTLADGLVEGAAGGDGLGGAILNNGGVLNVVQSLLRDNTALGGLGGGDGLGGAIFNDGGVLNLTNSTLTANVALGAGGGEGLGGGILNRNGLLTVLSSTLSGNVGGDGRNVYNLADGLLSTATGVVNNSILGQAGPADVTDIVSESIGGGLPLTSGLGNLIRNPGNFLGTVVSTLDPLLGPLTDNGGPTLSLLPGLPAINIGIPSLLTGITTDQRGGIHLRILGLGVDIGAIEVGDGGDDTTAPTVSSVTSTTPDGTYGVGAGVNVTVNFSEPVTLAGGNLTVALDSGGTVTLAPFTGTTATGTYTVAAGQTSADLDSTGLTLGAGATLKDAAGNAAALTVPAGASLADLKNIVISTGTTSDTTAPTVTIGPPSAAATARGPVAFTITYADPNFDASTLTAADVVLNATGTATGTVGVSAGAGSTRTVTISNVRGNGTLGISLNAGTARDDAGNLAAAAGPSATVAVTNTPILAVSANDGGVRVLNAGTGQPIFTFRPLDANGRAYTGLVQVALGDLTGDGVADVFVAPTQPVGARGLDASKAGRVFVYDGAALATGAAPGAFRAFTPFATHQGPDGATDRAYRNGLNIAVGDVNGDGVPDLIAGTRGGSATAGDTEYGRMVVVSGASAAGVTTIIGAEVTPFGNLYQKGVVVEAGDLDGAANAAGLPRDEVAVTRGGPVAASNPNKTIKLKAYGFEGGSLAELNLSGTGAPLAPFAAVTGPSGEVLARDGRLAFVDQNGDGRSELVVSILDPLSTPGNVRVRVATFAVDTGTGLATPLGAGSGASNSVLVGAAVKDHAIARVDADGNGTSDLALVTEGAPSGVAYLDPRTGAVLPGGFSLGVARGGVALDGF